MALLKSFSTVGGLTIVSRVLGFARDVLMSRFLGSGMAADAFIVAFKLPNFFRRLFAEGAFSAAFVPLFARRLGRDRTTDPTGQARLFAERSLAIFLPSLLVFTALAEVFMPWIVLGLTGGYHDADPAKLTLSINLTRMTFPYLMLVSLVSLFAGVLNGLGRYAAAAAAPILLNAVLIMAMLLYNDSEVMTSRGLAFAVSLAGLVQLAWMMIAAQRAGYPIVLRLPRLSPSVRELGRVMLPAALGAGAVQINLLIDVFLASRYLPEGSISYLYYGDRLNQLPIGVIGVAVGTVILPVLARSLGANDQARALADHNRAVEFSLLLTLPAAAALMYVPLPLIRAIYEHGAFGVEDSLATAATLQAYAVGLPAYVLIKALTPGFYARKDSSTPMHLSLVSLGVNLGLNLLLIGPLAQVGLALATAIAAWVNALLLFAILFRRGHFRPDARLTGRMIRLGLATGVMLAALWAAQEGLGQMPQVGQWAVALGLVFAGLFSFCLAAIGLGVVRRSDLAYLRRGRTKGAA